MHISLKITAFILVLCCTFTSCVTSKKINYLQTPGFHIPAYKDTVSFEDYRLRVGDRISVRVYSTDPKTNAYFNGGSNMNQLMSSSSDLQTFLIEESGNIEFPMIGEVAMVGKTIREATTALEKAIEPLFKFSTVELRIPNRRFSVLGNGKSAFINMPQEKINIFKALAMVGDIGLFSDKSKIRVLRETDDGVVIKTFDVRSADIIHSEFYYIEPNDVIYIQASNEQFFRITNLPTFITTVFSTVSFGVFIYDTVIKVFTTNSNSSTAQ